MSKLPLCNMKGDRVGEITLADGLLVLDKGGQAVHDAVEAHRAAERAGTASTRKRGAVSGGGAKPWRQKGTGRARHGSNRSPIWRGGGIVFGPHPRAYDRKLTKKVSRLAFRRALSEKLAAGEVMVIDAITLPEPKTKHMAAALKGWKADRGALVILGASDRNVFRAARNIPNVEVASAASVHTYQILRHPLLVVSRDGMDVLEARLKEPAGRTS